MKTVITYGTFDLFHIGHLRILERAKKIAGAEGRLIVAVSTDEFNWNQKQKKSVIPYTERAAIVQAIRWVDAVIPEETWDQKVTDVKKYSVDVFLMGNDWEGKFDFLKKVCEVVYLPRTEGISSSQIKSTFPGIKN